MNAPADGRRVAVVTGAGSGLGLVLVSRLLGAGLSVVATDSECGSLAGFQGRDDVAVVAGDITDDAVVASAIEAAVERFGRLDVLVNAAGAPDRLVGAAECTDREWRDGLALHLSAPFSASRLAIPHMRDAAGGLIVNVSSAAGWTGGNGGAAATAAAHALLGLTKNIAAMYADGGVRCIAVCPRSEETASGAELSPRGRSTRARTHGAFLRPIDHDEIADLIMHLVGGGDAALNGAILTADSGFAAHR